MQNTNYPFAIKLPYTEDQLFHHYTELSRNEPHHIFLESGRGGRYSIVGLNPFAIIEGKNGTLTISTNGKVDIQQGNPIDLMKSWMKRHKVETNEDLPDFQGGAIGFFSYDSIRYMEKLPNETIDDLEIPDLYFLIFRDIVIYDHQEKSLFLIAVEEKENKAKAFERLEKHRKQWEKPLRGVKERPIKLNDKKSDITLSQEEAQFKDAVKRVQDYIAAGDVFQVNLSIRQTQPLQTEPFHIYKKLRKLNPSPYMSYIQTPKFQVISGSPELLVKKTGNTLSTRPIAGTRSRGKDSKQDLELEKELLSNEKERAEHVMLVDLERNDLGRVCKFGSVVVDEFMTIEKYSHVMHIVSNVRGELADGKDAFDVVTATFPGGTITGAPKIRTMEIIEELEPTRRGIYTGSIGWIGFNGDMELNIVIRTMFTQGGYAHVQAGAGIVIDSNPEAEFKECLKKAKALWEAKRLSEQEIEKKNKKVELR